MSENNKSFKFITELPVWTDSKYFGKIKYSDLVDKNIVVEYYGELYSFDILLYNKKKRELLCKYKENEKYIKSYNFLVGKLGCLFQKFNRDTIYKNGDIIENQLHVLETYTKNRELDNTNIKYYKYKCLRCGNIDEISQVDLVQGNRCPVCSNHKIIKGMNDIATTHPYLVKYFVNIEDTYTHTYGSKDKVWFKCFDCGYKFKRTIHNFIKKSHKCPCCGDGKPYGEKLMCNVLCQLDINFIMEKTFYWSKNTKNNNSKLCGNKRYDFYLNNYNILLEIHGKQHYYDQGEKSYFYKSIEEEQENDRIKRELALKNGIKSENYIVIDCRKSELEWIKQNILKSRLSEVIDLSNIDWLKADKIANGSLILEVAKAWNNSNKNTNDLAKEFLLSSKTIREYLHRCMKNNLLTRKYDGKLEASKAKSINGKKQGKPIRVFFKNGNIKEYINFTTASNELGISKDAIRNLIKRESGFKSKNSINGYNEYLDGLTITLII